MGSYMVFPGSLDSEFTEESVNPVACCDNSATLVAIYKGKLHFQIYEIPNQEEYKKKDMINLRREVIANNINDFNFTP